MTHWLRMSNVCVYLAILLTTPNFASASAYSKTYNIQNLRISVDNLQPVIDQASNLARRADTSGSASDIVISEWMELSNGENSIKIDGSKIKSQSQQLPEKSTRFKYNFYSSIHGSSENLPISSVTLDFSPYSRTVVVDGSDIDEVSSLAASLKERLSERSSVIGGIVLDSLFAFFLYTTPWWLAWLILSSHHNGWQNISRAVRIASIVLLLDAFVIFAWISGAVDQFALYDGEPSLLLRYSPRIGLIGSIVSVAGLLLSLRSNPKLDKLKD